MTAEPPPETAEGASAAGDALRFAFGTLTVLPVRVHRWDRAAARGGMTAAPLAGAVVGLAAAAAGGLLTALGAGAPLTAVAAVAAPAVLTRGLHLDGLADTADGLGSGKPAQEALHIMKRSDIGPFGVVTLVLVLLAQVAALASCYGRGGWVYGGAAAVVAGAAGRVALTLACRQGVPSARPDGLGAAVAGSVPPRTAFAVAAACAGLAGLAGLGFSWGTALRALLAVPLALLSAEVLVRRCVGRFAGVTGDVLGCAEECAVTVALVVLSLT